MSSIFVICVKMSALCPPDLSVRRSCANAWSFPQSNCTSLRSGKKSCCRTAAARNGVNAGAPTFCDHAARSATAALIEADGAPHVIDGGGARAFGMANINCATRSAHSSALRAGDLTSSSSAGATANGPAPCVAAISWHACAGCGIVAAARRSAPYIGTLRIAAAAASAMRRATARRSSLALTARTSANKRTAASAAAVVLPSFSGGSIARAYAPPRAKHSSTSRGSDAVAGDPALRSSIVSKCNPRGAKKRARRGSSSRSRASFATIEGTRSVTPGSISNADTIGRPANKSGWLHTFRSCIRQLMIPRRFPEDNVVDVSELAMYSSYSRR
eukprot:24026-Pelagococcus_subviridis.AAC.1